MLTLPVVSANPSPGFPHTPAYAASYVALIILVMVIADFAVFLVRRKRLIKQSLFYLLALSCWVAFFIVTIYGGTHYITEFGYVTYAITYMTMAATIVAITYSGYLIIRRAKLVKKL
jgi:hypothetical protein